MEGVQGVAPTYKSPGRPREKDKEFIKALKELKKRKLREQKNKEEEVIND